MNIPFVDLQAQYLTIKDAVDRAMAAVVADTAFVGGKYVAAFEQEFALAYGLAHCVSVANGTDAIYISLKMLGVGPGDEVITVANSWISTSETITQTGARPVFVDIEPDYFTIDVSKIAAQITPRTKAIVPVHLYGQACDIVALQGLCKQHGLFLVEDCAQAHFTQVDGRNVGTFGQAATFSFYPGKNLGAYGDAGAILTNDAALAEKCRMYANHGALRKHEHHIEGINSRLDGLQAAILSAKLPHLAKWNESRLDKALYYNQVLADIPQLSLPQIRPATRHTFHLYVVRTPRRDELLKFLQDNGVGVAIHYPTALPLMPAYAYLQHTAEDFPVAAQYQNEILSLPMFPELTREQINHVAAMIRRFWSL